MIFQDPFASLNPRSTIGRILTVGPVAHGTPYAQARSEAKELLEHVGLDAGAFERFPHEFSGGQRQRLAIARALIIRPEVLVLDEPTSALDVTIQKQVLSLLQRLQQELGLSYLLITHDVDVIRAMAHDVLVMKDGDIVEHGTVEQILEAPAHSYTQRLLAAAA